MYDPDNLYNRNDNLIRATFQVIERLVIPYHRATVTGLEKVPDGPALFVGNHNGGTLSIDTFILSAELYREYGIHGMPHGLAHDLVIEAPILNQLLCQWGAVRASNENARRLFEEGRKIIVYPGGDMEAYRPYRRRNEVDFAGRTGFARLAIQNGVPIVPVVAHGAHGTLFIIHDFRGLARALKLHERLRIGVLPLSFLLPYGLWFGPPPPYIPLPAKITIEILDPIDPPRVGDEAAADEEYVADVASTVEAMIQQALTRLSGDEE